MDDILQRIADHVANEAANGALAEFARDRRCRVRDLDRDMCDRIREIIRKKLLFHLPRQIAQAKLAQLDPRAIGDRDTPLQDVDPRDVLHSWVETLPDGVARDSRPKPRDPRHR